MGDSRKMPLRVLHASDVHLEELNDRACRKLEDLVEAASDAKVDMVIIAGDLFEHNRVEDDLVRFAVAQLKRIPAYVVILPGNHDCLVPASVYERRELWKNCPNVRVFRAPQGEILNFPVLRVSLWGKPINSYEEDVRPLAGIPQPKKNGYWHIAMAHGYYVDTTAPLFPSYHISRKEIVASGWDYIALGHLITFGCVCEEPVIAFYSGSPSLTNTVAIVDFTETGIQVTRFSLVDKKFDII